MVKTLLCETHTTTPSTGLSSAVRERFGTAPNLAEQGTAVPFAGSSAATAVAAAEVAVAGVRSTDLPGSPSRGAPV
ncbi:MAG: hypothetical protein LH469_07740 [Frankiaceae bacterium]|nr:hypothetical protein [Frankiaceae bacterium]